MILIVDMAAGGVVTLEMGVEEARELLKAAMAHTGAKANRLRLPLTTDAYRRAAARQESRALVARTQAYAGLLHDLDRGAGVDLGEPHPEDLTPENREDER